MRSIVRRDDGRTYQTLLEDLAKASGIETPTREDLARLDRKRKEERLERRLVQSERSGREDHEDEGRPDAFGPQDATGEYLQRGGR
jgi:cobalamin-dependent methionine synthase I